MYTEWYVDLCACIRQEKTIWPFIIPHHSTGRFIAWHRIPKGNNSHIFLLCYRSDLMMIYPKPKFWVRDSRPDFADYTDNWVELSACVCVRPWKHQKLLTTKTSFPQRFISTRASTWANVPPVPKLWSIMWCDAGMNGRMFWRVRVQQECYVQCILFIYWDTRGVWWYVVFCVTFAFVPHVSGVGVSFPGIWCIV